MQTLKIRPYITKIKSTLFILLLAFAIRTFIYGLYQVPTSSMETTMLVGESFVANKFSVWFGCLERGDIIAFNDYWQFEYSTNPIKRLFQMYVWGPSNWTKRIIGMPGDHVKGVIEDGKPVVYVNDKKLDEPYVNQYPLIATYLKDHNPLDFSSYTYRSYDPTLPLDAQPFYDLNQSDISLAKKLYESLSVPVTMQPHTPAMNHDRTADEFDVYLKDTEYWVMGDNRLNSSDSRFNGPLPADYIHAKIVFRLWSIDTKESWILFDLLKHPIDFWHRVRWSRFFQTVC